jgi:anti-sigma factor ChrR (cupin superfamily)
MKHVTNIYDELGWKKATGYQVGTRTKVLLDQDGLKTILLKLPPGFHMDSHTHIYNEQHVVLEGEYESEGKLFESGTYRFIPAHKDHGPFASKAGAVIMVIWNTIQ